ncbi:MAG: aminopeptidase P family protein, partial [Acidobacteria bacterium]
MFAQQVYVDRRKRLQQQFDGGLLLFPGNADSPMNYAANAYHFRQDSSFLYYWGVDDPDLVAVLDVDSGRHVIFGNDFTVDDIVWRGPQPTIAERAAGAGVTDTESLDSLPGVLSDALRTGRR